MGNVATEVARAKTDVRCLGSQMGDGLLASDLSGKGMRVMQLKGDGRLARRKHVSPGRELIAL